MKIVAVFGLDTFRHKNLTQINLVNKIGYTFDVFVNDTLNNSEVEFEPVKFNNNLYINKRGIAARFRQVFCYLHKNKGKINHIEVYVGGKFQIFYILFAKLLKIPSIIIERGDIQWVDKLGRSNQFYYKCTYRLTDLVCYKEPYMERILDIYKVKNTMFLPNSIVVPDSFDYYFDIKKYHFLWVNRLIKERRIDRLLTYGLNNLNVKIACLGINENYQEIPDALEILLSQSMKSENIEIKSYVNPFCYFKKYRFFILDSDLVFGNYALLEAMSYGVVPIVRYTKWNHLIINNGFNGFEFQDDFESFTSILDKAFALNEEEYLKMSKAARETMLTKFSSHEWLTKVDKLYIMLSTRTW